MNHAATRVGGCSRSSGSSTSAYAAHNAQRTPYTAFLRLLPLPNVMIITRYLRYLPTSEMGKGNNERKGWKADVNLLYAFHDMAV